MPAPGFTLVELLVVLTILGLIAGVTGLTLSSLERPPESELTIDLKRARADAIRSGAARTAHGVRFLPDGRAIGPNVDPLSGEPDAK